MEAITERATVVEATTEHTTGPYGDRGCEETLHVTIDGEDVFVPWTGVRAAGYDYIGDVPDVFDVDRITLYDGHIHAEADVGEQVIEIIPEYSATAEFRSYDSWTLEAFDADAPSDATVIFERGGDE